MKLNQMGLRCLLLDKATFPRDKVCGDAISGKVTAIFNRIDPSILRRFAADNHHADIWGMRLVAPNHVQVDIPFKPRYQKDIEPVPGYVAKRVDFDNFLVKEVRRCALVDFRESVEIKDIEKTDGGFILRDSQGKLEVRTKLLIVANGANSAFSRHHAGIEKDPAHYAGAVRAYFRNVKGFHPDGFIELHFIKEYIPGYFWMFPLPGGGANVGLGLRTDYISRKRVNLKKELLSIVHHHPAVRDRFAEATLEGEVVGYPLPLGSRSYTISGDHFMLVGDAGHLIDPVTGEGIGNAIYSGWIAAEQAGKCFATGDFSAAFMRDYDVRVARVLGAEMKLSYQLQKLLAYPWLLNFFANRLHHRRRLMDALSRMYLDFEFRKQLVSPVFWAKLLLGRVPR